NGMGYLKLVILVLAYALIPPAFAQTCCPAGCAPEADRCVTTGPLWTRCIPIACADGSRKPSGDSAAGPTRKHRKSAVLARPLRIRYDPFGVHRQLSEHRLAYLLWRYLGRHRQFRACRPVRASAKKHLREKVATGLRVMSEGARATT